ncbi:MAG: YwiC-like family protein [Opitutae bacterium]|nr:YwiC-like family protein [Opitutae bacterium]
MISVKTWGRVIDHSKIMTAPSPTLPSLLLPKEHGSWSLAFEPLALGLLVAPSVGGLGLAAAMTAGFFLRRPLKLGVTLPAADPRRTPARHWALLLAVAALAALGFAAGRSSIAALWPLLLAAPFGTVFLALDLRHDMRAAAAELAGSAAFAVLPAAFATLAGWSAAPALALAAAMLARSLPTVLTVRTYLCAGKGQPAGAALPLAAAAASLALLAALAARGLAPWPAPVLAALLLARVVFLVTPLRPQWTARRLGLCEAVLGLLCLATLAVAYRLA